MGRSATGSSDDASAREGDERWRASGGARQRRRRRASRPRASTRLPHAREVDCSATSLQVARRPSAALYDPAGANPLYNAVVFIPNDPNGAMPPITQGTDSCNTCNMSIGDYVTATISGRDGKFRLTGVPATTHVPLVVQIGKWRREVFLSQVKGCTDNPSRLVADAPPREAIRGGYSADGSRHRRRRQPGLLPQGRRARPERVLCAPRRRAARHLSGAGGEGRGLGGGGGSAPGLSSGGTAGDCTTTTRLASGTRRPTSKRTTSSSWPARAIRTTRRSPRTRPRTRRPPRSKRSTIGSTRVGRSSRPTSTTPGSRTALRTFRAWPRGWALRRTRQRALQHRHELSQRQSV